MNQFRASIKKINYCRPTYFNIYEFELFFGVGHIVGRRSVISLILSRIKKITQGRLDFVSFFHRHKVIKNVSRNRKETFYEHSQNKKL
jgi:hypothetical protein